MPIYPRVAGTRAGIWPSWSSLCFLLHDGFPVTLGPPMVSPHFASPGPGQLILDQTDGQFSTTGGEFYWPVQGTPAWGDQEWHALKTDGDEYDVLSGKKLILKFRGAWLTDDEGLNCWFGFSRDTTPDTVANAEHTFYRAVAIGSGIRCTSGASDNTLALRDLWPPDLGDYFQAAIVLRPYTPGGLHWYPGVGGVHAHGAHFFWRDEAGEDSWRLAWYRQLQSRTDPIYPAFSNYDSAGKFDYVKIPCDDEDIWNTLFTPIVWDEFTDPNGTLLPVHAITYGPTWSWVSDTGIWIITGNKADPNAANPAVATIHTVTPDVWVEVAIDGTAEWIGLTLRMSADTSGGSNRWMCYIKDDEAGIDTYITEFNDGGQTHRATADNDWPAQTAHNIRVRAAGLQITFYVDYVEELHYASAWFNEHATWHGLYAQVYDAARFDNFIILPRGTGLTREGYDNFDDVNATRLEDHTPLEGAHVWVEHEGVWTIVNAGGTDQYVSPNASNPAHALHECGTDCGDVWLCSRIQPNTDNRSIGVTLRESEDTAGGHNLWVPYIRSGVAGNDTLLLEVDDGAVTTRAQADVDHVANTWYYMDAHALGQVITVYIDGTQALQYTTATFNETAGGHGLYAANHATACFDQFRITEIPALGEYDSALDSF